MNRQSVKKTMSVKANSTSVEKKIRPTFYPLPRTPHTTIHSPRPRLLKSPLASCARTSHTGSQELQSNQQENEKQPNSQKPPPPKVFRWNHGVAARIGFAAFAAARFSANSSTSVLSHTAVALNFDTGLGMTPVLT
jgi:hypothetical protein